MKWAIGFLFLFASSANALPRVLIVGDSISLGYTKYVQQELSGRYEVFHATGGPLFGNDRSSTYFLANIDRIIDAAGKVNVIHANWGLWDLDRRAEDVGNCFLHHAQRTPPQQYLYNLFHIIPILKKTGAKIILATITPVPDSNICIVSSDVDKYNSIIKFAAEWFHLKLDDLNTLMQPYDYLHIKPRNCHYVEIGYQYMSFQVSQSIELSQ